MQFYQNFIILAIFCFSKKHLQKKQKHFFCFQFSKFHIFFKNDYFSYSFMSERLKMYILKSVDGILMKINICCFSAILPKFHDFGNFFLSMRALFLNLWVWKTDKVPQFFFHNFLLDLKMSFHTPSYI